jgi:hypothetical protein
MLRSFLLAALLISSSLAFAPSPLRPVAVRNDGLPVTTLGSSNSADNDEDESIDMVPLVLKFGVIMGIKTVQDAIIYPTIYASNAVQNTRRMASDTSSEEVNVPLMFIKFVAIMTFKTIHDILYYPSLYLATLITADEDEDQNNDNK